MFDDKLKLYRGTVEGNAFTAMPNGDISCERVSDFIRDNMRLQAATEFLLAARSLHLSHEDREHWRAINATTATSNLAQPTRNVKACNP